MTERVLPYNRQITPQDTGYWCGPASTQVVLDTRRIHVPEADLARECRTTQNGTDYVGLIEKVLDVRLPEGRYTSIYLEKDPPSAAQKDRLWWDIVRSIDNGFGVVMNWVAPPGNKPKGVKGSPNPSYGGGTTYHYVAAMGWSDEGNGGRRSVWIADSGFRPFGYWCDFDQVASLIPPKGYCFADLPLTAPPPPGVKLPPGVTVVEHAPPPPRGDEPQPPPTQVEHPPGAKPVKLKDPRTVTVVINNSYRPRGMPMPKWIGVHTSESNSRVRNLNEYCRTHKVGYNRLVDDTDILVAVEDKDAPWAAVGANKYALHVCASSSFASWSRDKWLDTEVGPDGINEAAQLANIAKVVAYWCSEHGIPPVWIGDKAQPPWGMDGICGHRDFGQWGGGHSDPGVNFPRNELVRQVTELLSGTEQPPLVVLPPVVLPGTDPDKYGDWMLWAGNTRNDANRVKRVQRRLKKAYASYAGHLEIDGIFGEQTKAAVREFQGRVHIVADGIVGPNTAAALKP